MRQPEMQRGKASSTLWAVLTYGCRAASAGSGAAARSVFGSLCSLPYIMMLLCYLAVGTVLFDQITCLPLMLILIGIGIRQE